MNIGLLITRFPPDQIGGAELQAKQLATALAQRGHNVTVFTRRYHGRPFMEQQDGYRICRHNELPLPGVRMAWDIVPTLTDFARHSPRLHVLLCYQTLSSGLIGAAAQAVLGIPAIVSIRGSQEYHLDCSLAHRLLTPPIYRRVRRIIVQSSRIGSDLNEQLRLNGQTALSKQIAQKIVVIPNGIDLTPGPPSNGTKIVYVGRLIREKGVADLLQALKCLPTAETLIVGDGPDRQRLESLAAGLPVTFIGQVRPSQVADYLQQARLLVLPSHLGDGLPNVILEAMACGVPAVATHIAGIPDLVHHGKTGFLFTPGDVAQMAGFMRRLLTDDSQWRCMAQRSRELVSEYSWDLITPRIEQLLRQVSKERQ
ncbi:MAG: glycosyltransferase family 4 protein [Caldilineaceae bacterium]|nr:glycosyltransferase family 4 protein [Caldilineaceae bacterium]